jgi:hypothetical protein
LVVKFAQAGAAAPNAARFTAQNMHVPERAIPFVASNQWYRMFFNYLESQLRKACRRRLYAAQDVMERALLRDRLLMPREQEKL